MFKNECHVLKNKLIYLPEMIAPRPDNTAVFCKQFPAAIQRAVSSPS